MPYVRRHTLKPMVIYAVSRTAYDAKGLTLFKYWADTYGCYLCIIGKHFNAQLQWPEIDISLKASQMGHFVMISLWCASLSTNTRFRFLYFRIINC